MLETTVESTVRQARETLQNLTPDFVVHEKALEMSNLVRDEKTKLADAGRIEDKRSCSQN